MLLRDVQMIVTSDPITIKKKDKIIKKFGQGEDKG